MTAIPDRTTYRVKLTRGYWARIDADDVDAVTRHHWHVVVDRGGQVFAKATIKNADGSRREIALHRFLLAAPTGVTVRALDGDMLNCTRANLVMGGQHRAKLTKGATSRFRGVSLEGRRRKRWRVDLRYHGAKEYLGNFETEEEAAAVWDERFLALGGPPELTNRALEERRINPPPVTPIAATLLAPDPVFALNTSGYRGVSKMGSFGRYPWRCLINYRANVAVSYHATAIEAAKAWDAQMYQLFGADVRLNFPEDYPDPVTGSNGKEDR